MVRRNPGLANPGIANPGGQLTVDPSLSLNPQEIQAGSRKYADWHWSIKPQKVVDWNDPDMPRMLIECGKLIRMHVRAPQATPKHPRRQRDTMIEFSRRVSKNSHVAYDPDHPYERLYLLVDPKAQEALRERFWDENSMREMNLNQLAAIAGGRHGQRADYPNLSVKPIGILTDLIYLTSKHGDSPPPSFYIHALGEISGRMPILAIDGKGRLWLAGGHYRTLIPGVTD